MSQSTKTTGIKVIFPLIFFCLLNSHISTAQNRTLQTSLNIEYPLYKDEVHAYTLALNKNEFAELAVMQNGIDVIIDILDPKGVKLSSFDSPNGDYGEEPVSVQAKTKGNYTIKVYKLSSEPVMLNSEAEDSHTGTYSISNLLVLSPSQYRKKLEQEEKDKEAFQHWITQNTNPVFTVDAGKGYEDLQPLKSVLKNVRVVGMGESTHGTSEFFRFKHRMFEFLVKEMGYSSFYLEASVSRCRYINDYVLYGKGSLDTATSIQGFVTWRVEEFRDLIEWVRQYNSSVSGNDKVTFKGFDLQVNNLAWKGLGDFYRQVNPGFVHTLDSLKVSYDTAINWSNNMAKSAEGSQMLRSLYPLCKDIMSDLLLRQGQYEFAAGAELFNENLMNIKLIVQEIESFKDGYNDRRDYYMAQNIMQLLNEEKPGSKVMVWAHNMHIANVEGAMGHYLHEFLKEEYYSFGFEFYSGSFQSRNLDTGNNSHSWDIIQVGEPPLESLPWYFEKYGKGDFFIDFRYTGTNLIKNFQKAYHLHSFGSMYSKNWPITYPAYLNFFDGMIFIRNSTAAKNFTRVLL
jgi:erythromycin esterase